MSYIIILLEGNPMYAEYTGATVGELVAQRPRRSKVFEQYGIDYCCGGKKPLTLACAEKAVDFDSVARDLANTDAQPRDPSEVDWTKASLTDLADHIVEKHHEYLREALPRISGLTAKVAEVHGGRRPELREVKYVFDGLRAELETHMMKEEQILFPMLRQLESPNPVPEFHCGTVQNPIRVMEHEHDSAGMALARLNKLTEGYVPPEDACGTYRAMLDALAELEEDLHVHIHKENEILFPRGAALEEQRIDEANAF